MDKDRLAREYRDIGDEELIEMWRSGKLTELAHEVAANELRQRGIDLDRLPRAAVEPDSEPGASTSGFVTVYKTLSLSQAQLLRARLQVEGFPPYVADEHTVQTDQLLAPAMGGFRVRVPREMADEARQLLSDIEAGKLALDDGDQTASAAPAPVSLWNPDVAAALSVVLTPVFGAVIHALNWKTLREERRARAAWVWAGVMFAVFAAAALHGQVPGTTNVRATFALVLLVSLAWWYFGAARAQSKFVVNELKSSYVRASWFTPIWLAAILGSGVLTVVRIFR